MWIFRNAYKASIHETDIACKGKQIKEIMFLNLWKLNYFVQGLGQQKAVTAQLWIVHHC